MSPVVRCAIAINVGCASSPEYCAPEVGDHGRRDGAAPSNAIVDVGLGVVGDGSATATATFVLSGKGAQAHANAQVYEHVVRQGRSGPGSAT